MSCDCCLDRFVLVLEEVGLLFFRKLLNWVKLVIGKIRVIEIMVNVIDFFMKFF